MCPRRRANGKAPASSSTAAPRSATQITKAHNFDNSVTTFVPNCAIVAREVRPQHFEERKMKKLIAIALLTFSFTASAMAAEFKGFVEDTACAGKPGMAGDAECAKSCIKGGSPAVLV